MTVCWLERVQVSSCLLQKRVRSTSGGDISCDSKSPLVVWLTHPEYELLRHHLSGIETLTVEPQSLGSNPGVGMDVCKCIGPSWHGGTLNSRRVASPLVWLVEEEERVRTLNPPLGYSFKSVMEPIQIVQSPIWCSKLRLSTSVYVVLSHDEFPGT
ncbi:hypothetical protein TNCV_3951291 [Trichonephila clavipes]|nr:hypothetical protein TNCV_3951291 [Trichonephila clavipes]